MTSDQGTVPRTPTACASVPRARPATAGRGRLEIVRCGTRSVVTRAFATSPLRLLTPSNHGHGAWVYTSSYGGGLVNGDEVDLGLTIGAGACAYLSTQASTKVYRSPGGTSATLRARVGAGALLVVAPDPVVCFAGGRYRQLQRFDLDDRAALVAVDCYTSGRSASGERWAFREYRSLIEVTRGERLLLHDATALRARDGALAPRLGRFDAVATIVITGASLKEESARLVSQSASQPALRRADRLSVASPLGDDGCLVRVAAASVEHAWDTVRQALRFVAERLGDDPWSRKW